MKAIPLTFNNSAEMMCVLATNKNPRKADKICSDIEFSWIAHASHLLFKTGLLPYKRLVKKLGTATGIRNRRYGNPRFCGYTGLIADIVLDFLLFDKIIIPDEGIHPITAYRMAPEWERFHEKLKGFEPCNVQVNRARMIGPLLTDPSTS